MISNVGYAQPYNCQYQNVKYQSNQPHNLNIYYFRASDIPADSSMTRRVSGMSLWLQRYYKNQMQANGYGNKTFGLWTSITSGDSVRIVIIHGVHPLNFYRSSNPGGNDSLHQEVEDFIGAHPQYQLSEHSLVLIGTPSVSQMNGLPYYGLGKTCYATDYPQLDTTYIGQTGQTAQQFVTYFGGIAHELGHALNLPHSHQTLSESQNPQKGTNLMADGNYTLTASPTFINRAGCAILNRCQLFNTDTASTFYNGHIAGITTLYSQFANNQWIVSGRIVSNVPVTDINFYQDPFQDPSAGYQRVAFSVTPLGSSSDSFRVVMPVNEVLQGSATYPPNGPWNMDIELVLQNGETENSIFRYRYQNSQVVAAIGFQDQGCNGSIPGFQLTDIGYSFAPGSACYLPIDSSLVMRSWGESVGGQTDHMPFLWHSFFTGDTLEARIRQISERWNDQIGLMLRSSLDSNAAFAAISALDSRGVFWNYRSQNGSAGGYNIVTSLALPFYVRLIRHGNTVSSYYSINGQSWTFYNSRNLALGTQAYAGLFIGKAGARGMVDQIRYNNQVMAQPEIAVAENNGLQLWPNPASTEIRLRFPQPLHQAVILIIDVTGKERLIQKLSGAAEETISLSQLAEGLYLVRVEAAQDKMYQQKLVIGGGR